MNIYHYTKTSTLIEHILLKNQLRASYLNSMNDPRERERFAFGGVNVPYNEIYEDYYSDKTHIDCQYRLGEDIKNRLQVLCFSGARDEGWNNEMMWAQYADAHKGICIELDAKIIEQALSALTYSYKLETVAYDRAEKASIYWNRELNIEENILNFISNQYRSLAFAKSNCWAAEDEIRLIIVNQKSQVFVPIQHALKGIYLGTDFNPVYLPSIANLLSQDVKIYRVIYQHYKFERWSGKFENGKWKWV